MTKTIRLNLLKVITHQWGGNDTLQVPQKKNGLKF